MQTYKTHCMHIIYNHIHTIISKTHTKKKTYTTIHEYYMHLYTYCNACILYTTMHAFFAQLYASTYYNACIL